MSANNPYQAYPYQTNYGGVQTYQQRAYGYQPQPQFQQQMQMQQQMPPMELPIQDIKFVNKAQADAYIVFPNTKVVLIDTESGIAHIKTADGMGQSRTEYYRFEQVNADGSPIKPQESPQQINFDEFVKKEQLKELGFVTFEQYKEIAQKIEQLQKKLEGVKSNGSRQS